MEPKYNPDTPGSGPKTDPVARASEFGKQSLEEVRGESERLAERVQSEGRKFLIEKKNLAAENVQGFAEALRITAKNLEEHNNPTIAGWVNRTAEVVSGWSHTLRDSDMNELSFRARESIRRNRGLVVGGAFVVGFMLSRFLKTSYEPGASETELTYRRRRPMEESREPAILVPPVSPHSATDVDTGTPDSKKPKPFSGLEP